MDEQFRDYMDLVAKNHPGHDRAWYKEIATEWCQRQGLETVFALPWKEAPAFHDPNPEDPDGTPEPVEAAPPKKRAKTK